MKSHHLHIIIILFFNTLLGSAQENEEPLAMEFSLLRQNDRIGNPGETNRNLYNHLKLMKLSDHASLSFGGSVRLQGESFINESFIEESNHDNFWFLERTELFPQYQ